MVWNQKLILFWNDLKRNGTIVFCIYTDEWRLLLRYEYYVIPPWHNTFRSPDLTFVNSEPVQYLQLFFEMSEGHPVSAVEWTWQILEPKSLISPRHQVFAACHIAFCPSVDRQVGKPLMFWFLLNVVSKLAWKFWRLPWILKESELQQPVLKFLCLLWRSGWPGPA